RATSNMNTPLELLQELSQLHSHGAKERRIFLNRLPADLSDLAKIKPPCESTVIGTSSNHRSYTLPDNVQRAEDILTAIASVFPKVQHLHRFRVVSTLRKYWSAMHLWMSYMVKTYIESGLPYDSDDDSIGIRMLRTVLVLCSELLSTGVIRIQELESTPGAADMVVRVQIYGLCVHPSARLLDLMINGWNDIWFHVHRDTLNNISIPASTALIKVLTCLCQKRPLTIRYRDLSQWLFVWSMGTETSQMLLQQSIKRRSVYFVTHTLTRIGKNIKNIESTKRLQNIINDLNVVDTWKYAVRHLCIAFDYGGYDTIVFSLEMGLLSALWYFSQVCGDCLLAGHTVDELYGTIVEKIAAASMYRIVLKTLQKVLRKHPLRDATSQSDQVQKHSDPIWKKFEEVMRVRTMFTEELLLVEPKVCADPKCNSPSVSKLFRCSACQMTYYCSRPCQKSHRSEHRDPCYSRVAERKEGVPRSADSRDLNSLLALISHELRNRQDEVSYQDAYKHTSP
ncbi:hypothetical protein BDP27DRAFT_1341583, partial [Rhodocollybia butyracea]